jgi:mitochondrial fission protein ELM1
VEKSITKFAKLNTNKQSSPFSSLSCWIITGGRAGTEIQCIALAEKLGLTPILKRVDLRFPWVILPEPLWILPLHAFKKTGNQLTPPWPDIIIASGRSSVAAAAKIRKITQKHPSYTLHKKATFVIQIQDPRVSTKKFDAVIVPFHSDVKGENVLQIHGSLHTLTSQKIKDAQILFQDTFSSLPSPRIAVMIGGKNKYYQMPESFITSLAKDLIHLHRDYGASFMITVSRRTPATYADHLKRALEGIPFYCWDNKTSPNPYLSMLSWADYILITEDSVSMVSEACSTGKPVYTLKLEGSPCRLDRFHKQMQEENATRLFSGVLEPWNPVIINDLDWVSKNISIQLKQHFDS